VLGNGVMRVTGKRQQALNKGGSVEKCYGRSLRKKKRVVKVENQEHSEAVPSKCLCRILKERKRGEDFITRSKGGASSKKDLDHVKKGAE